MHAAMHIIIFGFVCRVSDPQDMAIWGETRVSSIFGVLSEGNSEWPVNFDLHGYTMIYSLGDLRPWSLIPMSGWWFQILFIFHNIWDNPSHWLTFFKMVKTTNLQCFKLNAMYLDKFHHDRTLFSRSESWFIKRGNHGRMAQQFSLGKYYNLPRYYIYMPAKLNCLQFCRVFARASLFQAS